MADTTMSRKKNKQDDPMDFEAAVEAAGHEEIASGVDGIDPIEQRIEVLEAAVDEANNKALRTLADFQNDLSRPCLLTSARIVINAALQC